MSNNKVALVTGAARGIGKAISKQLLDDGFTVVAVDLSAVDWTDSDKLLSFQLDICDKAAVEALANKLSEKQLSVRVLVNNAGITRDALLNDMTEPDWDCVLDVNLKAVFLMTQQILPMMQQSGEGSIINISSIVGTDGNIGQSNYAASKGGVIAMSKGWAKEFPRKGANIRVNCIAPGFIETDMTRELPEKVIELMKSKTPLGRMGLASDIADGVSFLASEKSRFITGQILKIDGGLVI